MRISFLVSTVLLAWSVAGTASAAAPATDAEAALQAQCLPGSLRDSCVNAVCASISTASRWTPVDKAAFNGFVVALAAQLDSASPTTASAIRTCVALGNSVADTGASVSASPQ